MLVIVFSLFLFSVFLFFFIVVNRGRGMRGSTHPVDFCVSAIFFFFIVSFPVYFYTALNGAADISLRSA